MANAPNNVNRLFDGGVQFFNGLNSNLHPSAIGAQAYAWAINVINKGGIISTRPGYLSLFRLPDGKAQGMTVFTPKNDLPSIVAAVSGKIYFSRFPFTDFDSLDNVQFDPFVDHIAFKEAVQSIENGKVVDPINVLIMQDGKTRPAFWDGTVSRHLSPGGLTKETVIGLWMEFVGYRLWVARGRELFASDIFDPFHFIETGYIAEGGSLQAIDGDIITGLKRTADNKNLLVYTANNTTIIQTAITDRAQWKTTPGFVSLLFPGVGAVSGKSVFDHNGELWWFSKEGARRFTQVGATILSSRNAVASLEMDRSFQNLSPILNRVAGFSCGTYLGFSVPSGDIHNRHTWVLDVSIADQLTAASPPAWQSVWMGTRPVEWAKAVIEGKEHCFFLSQDRCGVRVWEAFQKDHKDNGGRIFCSLETAGHDFKEPISYKRFLFEEIHLTKMLGTVDMTIEYRGDWGCFKNIGTFSLCAKDCESNLACPGKVGTLQPQNRLVKSQEALHSCISEEGAFSEDIGTFFQTRIRWFGRNGIRMYKVHANQFQETSTGACQKSDVVCKQLLCCDAEVDYVSTVSDGYNYGSVPALPACSL